MGDTSRAGITLGSACVPAAPGCSMRADAGGMTDASSSSGWGAMLGLLVLALGWGWSSVSALRRRRRRADEDGSLAAT
jgi:hypothetical protein